MRGETDGATFRRPPPDPDPGARTDAPDLAGATRSTTTAPGLAFPAHAPEETVRTAWQKRDARLHLPGRLLRAEVAFDIDACTSVGTWHAGTPFAWTTPGAPPTNERTISG